MSIREWTEAENGPAVFREVGTVHGGDYRQVRYGRKQVSSSDNKVFRQRFEDSVSERDVPGEPESEVRRQDGRSAVAAYNVRCPPLLGYGRKEQEYTYFGDK